MRSAVNVYALEWVTERVHPATGASGKKGAAMNPSLKDPEHWEVDAALEAIEWENHRQELALWREQQRQREYPSRWKVVKGFLWFFTKCVLLATGAVLTIYTVMALAEVIENL